MTPVERVRFASSDRLTERQARFLVLVMQHAGVCLPRQFASFAGITYGQQTCDFFERLVRWGYAVPYTCRHYRGRVYHVRYKPLYRAIDDADSRFRRSMSAAQVVDRLAMVDALISTPNVSWLGSAEDRQARFAGGLPDVLNKVPIGAEPDGRIVVLFLAMKGQLDEFQLFLQRCGSVLSTLPSWTIRVVLAREFGWLSKQYDDVFRQELASPAARHLNELCWYFEQRQASSQGALREEDEERYYEDRFAFGASRFQLLYRRWLKEGEAAFEVVTSPALSEAITSGAGRIECAVLPFSYRLVSPLVDGAHPPSAGAEKGDNGPARPQPSVGWLDRLAAIAAEGAETDGRLSIRRRCVVSTCHLRQPRAAIRAGGVLCRPPHGCGLRSGT